jgi:hypothetical protein
LTHELAHVARRDVLWQTLAALACAVYWPHPLAWAAAWRMRIERELACDDWVLSTGESSTRYARWLLEIAGRLSDASQPADRLGVAMARAGGLEARLGAILDAARRRNLLSRRAAVSLAVAAIAITVLLAIINPTAAPSKALAANAPTSSTSSPATQPSKFWEKSCEISGIVTDEDGKPASGIEVDFQMSVVHVSTLSGADGRFQLKIPGPELGARPLWARTADRKLQAFFKNPEDDADRKSTDIHLILKPAKEFPITVVDQTGQPVSGAWIAAAESFEPVGSAQSDAEGRAVLRVPADAELMYALAFKAGRAMDYFSFWRRKDVRSNPYRLDTDYHGPLHFVLGQSITATVHVIDADHHPLPGVSVNPWYFRRPKKGDDLNLFADPRFHATTDAQGLATIDFIPQDNEGKVNIWTRIESYDAKDRCLFDPKGGSAQVEQVLRRLVHITGKVLEPNGDPARALTVLIGGAGYDMDGYVGEATTDEQGVFGIDVPPEKYYMFVAARDHLASEPVTRIIRDRAPDQPIIVKLKPGVRIFGQVTLGAQRAPVADVRVHLIQQDYDSYNHLPEEQRFPGGLNGRKAIIPSVGFPATKTDSQGRWEFYATPGRFYASSYFAGQSVTEHFKVSAENEQAVNLHVEAKTKPVIKGRVVLVSNPQAGVPEADISGSDLFLRDACISDQQGNFVITQDNADHYLSALTHDGLRGVTFVKSDVHTATIAVAPTASLRARLIDTAGRPIAQRPVRYGVRITKPGSRMFNWEFGGEVTTDEEGFFTATGLIPGYEYELNPVSAFNADGLVAGWHTVAKNTPQRAEMTNLGDLTLPDPPKRKTPSDYASESFHPAKALEQRMERARHVAEVSYQRVLVLLGAPSDPAAVKFFDLRYGEDRSDVWKFQANYVLVAIDAADADARNWAKQAGVNWPTRGFTFAVFEIDGKLLTQIASDALCVDGKLDRQKLNDFMKQYIPAMPDGRKLLDDALARAKREGKRVLVDQSGPYCGWCVKLADYLQANRAIIERDLIWVTLDLRFDHTREILEAIQPPPNPDKPRGVPWMAILSADGKVLTTSDAPKGNIGFPGEAEGLAHWEKMLRTESKNLTDADIKVLLESVK